MTKHIKLLAATIGASFMTISMTACTSVSAQEMPSSDLVFDGREGSPLSQAVRVDKFLYMSGMLGISREEPNGIGPETKRAMDAMGEVLTKHGLTYDSVFKCTAFLADMGEWSAFNEVYVTYFQPNRRPARSAVEVAGLAVNARVEVECIAYAG